jgi:hypothetical protein
VEVLVWSELNTGTRQRLQHDVCVCVCVCVTCCFASQVLAMGELIKQGKIKHWGVSNETTFGECYHDNTADCASHLLLCARTGGVAPYPYSPHPYLAQGTLRACNMCAVSWVKPHT